jgi:two-component system, OmpR family, sensor histidine kinase KdpD
MLEAAREQIAIGSDVVVAYIETHGRVDTEALLAGLPIVPRRAIDYRSVGLEEMDLDGVLARRPELALVDELAHTNAPGSRHAKRYQDIEELLAAGINVYTTVNVQHIESLNDVVAQITGVTVRETVPDRIIERADEAELVDLSPDELIQRLREGKVYVPDQASRAVEKFFRVGNLTALREIALRYLASHVDLEMRTYMGAHAIAGPWPAAERVLVCIDHDPLGERLVRTGRRLAAGLDAEWIVLHVETPEESRLSESARDRIRRTVLLAEELGAKVVTLAGAHASEEIVRYALAQNVTKILVGASHHPRWVELIHGSVVDRVIRASGHMDVYVITGPTDAARPLPHAERVPGPRSYAPYVYSAVIVGLVTAVSGLAIRGRLAPPNLTMLYLLSVVIIALQWGRGPAILAAALGVFAFDFFFVEPRFSFAVGDTQYLLTFAGLLVVGMVISTLAGRAKEQAEAVRRREANTTALYALSNDLAAAGDLDSIVDAVTRHVASTFSRDAAVLLPQDGRLVSKTATSFFLDENEFAVATYAFQHGEPAGVGTDTLPGASARYLPLKTAQKVVGVLAVRPANRGTPLALEQRRLLQAFASQAALAIERANLADMERRLDVLRESERLQAALLNSISHDLRTPLASITGALTSLVDSTVVLDDRTKSELLETAKEQADHLNRLVGNLVEMTRLEGGAVKLRLQPTDVEDLVGAALTQAGDALQERPVKVHIDPDLPDVRVDFVLMTQVLANLIDNAVKYTPPATPIDIAARAVGSDLQIQIADRGPGIPDQELGRIFEKFYRVRRPGDAGGVGLGLAISAGIVELHGGRIWAENRDGGGAVVTFSLPVGAPKPLTGQAA